MAKSAEIFTAIGNVTDSLLTKIQEMSVHDKLAQLEILVSGLIALSIMYKGFMVLAGKSQDPVRELVWDLGRKMLLFTFAMNTDQWLYWSIEAVRGIYTWAGGGPSFYQGLDSLTDSVMEYIKIVWSTSGWVVGNDIVASIILIIIVSLCFVAIAFELFFSIIACSVSNAFLIVALPLALFCFMWNQTRQVFTQWCQLLLSNTFTLIFLSMFLNFCISATSTIFNVNELSNKDTINLIIHVFEVVLISFVLVQITKVIKSLAQNLAQVSLDSAMSGVGASQMAGSVLGSTARMAGSATKGAAAGFGLLGKSAAGASGLGAAIERGGIAGAAGFAATKGLGMAGGVALKAGKALLSKMRER